MSNYNLADPNQLSQVLHNLSANSTEIVKNSEKILKPFVKKPQCIELFIIILTTSQDVTIRHHASLLLKKKILTHYRKFNQSQQNDLKMKLLSMLVVEPEKVIRTALAGTISMVAKGSFAVNQQWPELYSALSQLVQDPNEQLRETAYNLAGQLVEQVSNELKKSISAFVHMFVTGCQDASPAVAESALGAASAFIRELGREPEIMEMQTVLNPMLNVMNNCLQNGNEDTVLEGLEVIQELCSVEAPLINDHIEVVAQFAMNVLQGADYDSGLKQSAGQTLMNIMENRPKVLAKKNLVGPILSALMTMISQTDSSAAGSLFSFSKEGVLNEDDDDEDEDFSPEMDVQRLSQTIIDTMAISIPSKYFVEPALSLCAQGMASPDPHMRKAGCAVLGVIAEGCCDRIKENLGQILPRILELVQDNEFFVRECACFALGQFSEFCQPDILHYNQTVLPVLFHALDDSKPTVQGTCCYVLEYFCEGLQPETLRPYLHPLMTRLANLLQKPERNTKEMALTAIAATAVAAEIDFLPFTETICNILSEMMFLTDPKQFVLRGRALECLGHVAVAIGAEHFGRYFENGMNCAVQGIQLNDETLKEHSFVFFANAGKVMGKQFQNYLPQLVPFLLEVVGESELVKIGDEDDEEDKQGVPIAGMAAGTGDEDDDEDSFGDIRLNVEEGFVNAKKAALSALGALAEHTEELFIPYLESTLNGLLGDGVGAVFSLHEVVRAEAYSIIQHLIGVALRAVNITVEPKFGEVIPLNGSVHTVATAVMSAYVFCIQNDEEKLSVAYANEGLCGALKKLGIAGLQLPYQAVAEEELHSKNKGNKPRGSILDELVQGIMLILAEKAPCQLHSYDTGGEEDDDDSDHDNLVMDSITDVIAGLAKILGPNFVPYFDEFQKHLLKFMKPARLYSDRSMVIGCYGEVVMELGPAANKYISILLPAIQASLADPMEGVRRNAAFCVGVLVQSTGTALVPQFLQILQWLHPLCIRKESQQGSDVGGADVDNALAAVVRMINASPASVPLNQVLPVLLQALPLRDDNTEGPVVYKCLADLVLTANDPTALSLLPQIVSAHGETLFKGSNALDKTKHITLGFLKQLSTSPQHTNVVTSYLSQIPDNDNKQLLHQLISN